MFEVLVALLFGYFAANLANRQHGGGGGGVEPIPPGKQPPKGKQAPAPAPAPQYGPPEPPPAPSPKGTEPAPVPPSYKPPGGYVPYGTGWSYKRANELLHQPSVLPIGSSKTETEPGTGKQVMFRAESGKQHGDPNLKRAVTAWTKAT